MSDATRLEPVIETVSGLKETVTGLKEAYNHLPTALEREHEAIESGQLSEMENAGQEKQRITDEINGYFDELSNISEKLAGFRQEILGGERQVPASLSECLETLDSLTSQFQASGLGAQVLSHQVSKLRELVDQFIEQTETTKPLIEKNKYLVERMLSHYQQSYRFWQEIAEETQTSYDARGMQETKGRQSGFKARV